jgi:hypothetical protein
MNSAAEVRISVHTAVWRPPVGVMGDLSREIVVIGY